MRIHILGCCAGTEPREGKDYTSWTLEEDNGSLLWFDAGGRCGVTACLMGLPVTQTKALFLSHPHLDHTAGLPMILQVARKMKWVRKAENFTEFVCYSPDEKVLDGAAQLYEAEPSAYGPDWDVKFTGRIFQAGSIYRDEECSVEAAPNKHMSADAVTGKPRSYSFRINCPHGKIIYTGDIRSPEELSVWLSGGCDLLMLETGHHNAAALCGIIRQNKWPVGNLLFLHHGGAILNDPEGEKRRAEAVWGGKIFLARDRMTLNYPLNERISNR